MSERVYGINEQHLGSDATPEQAERMTAMLTRVGYPARYSPSAAPEPEREAPLYCIPDSTWDRCLTAVANEQEAP